MMVVRALVKGRIFWFVCGLLVVTGIIACYHNTRLQLDDVQKNNEQCRQQQERVSAQLQVIFDYKQRLEQSLKAEKAEHLQTKTTLENKLKEKTEEHEKVLNENKLRFTSLQQQHKLLQRQFDDYKEDAERKEKEQLDEVAALQSKLQEVKEELQQLTHKKKELVQHIKNTDHDRDMMEKKIQDLQKQLSNKNNDNNIDLQNDENTIYTNIDLERSEVRNVNFSKQISQGHSAYKIAGIDSVNNNNNENDAQNVIPMPNANIARPKVSTSSTKSSVVSKANLDNARPLGMPTATPETKIKSSSSKMLQQQPPINSNKVPSGVVPVQQRFYPSKEDRNGMENPNLPGRYGNNINDVENVQQMPDKNKDVATFNRDIADKENGALEEIDPMMADNQLDFPNDKLDRFEGKQHINNLQIAEDHDEAEMDKPEDVGDEEDDPDYQEKHHKEPPAVRN